ncbi:hypothetical protein NDN08_007116 [Rhodosorus marinus]|uniref:Uncharacterized protein n=1 Tax=Rhodosorus marinus TaxID=101924 RepID=A0AAV8UJC3_9RHOD|nr:hypothetical protein NDN08_007116 [Rhodosorus marinus]
MLRSGSGVAAWKRGWEVGRRGTSAMAGKLPRKNLGGTGSEKKDETGVQTAIQLADYVQANAQMKASRLEPALMAAPKKNRWVNFSGMSLCSDGQSVVMKADLQTDPTRSPHARGEKYTLEALVSVQLTFFDKTRLSGLKRGDTVFVSGPLKTWRKDSNSDIDGKGEMVTPEVNFSGGFSIPEGSALNSVPVQDIVALGRSASAVYHQFFENGYDLEEVNEIACKGRMKTTTILIQLAKAARLRLPVDWERLVSAAYINQPNHLSMRDLKDAIATGGPKRLTDVLNQLPIEKVMYQADHGIVQGNALAFAQIRIAQAYLEIHGKDANLDIGAAVEADAESIADEPEKDFAEGILAQHLMVPDFTSPEPSVKTL